MTSPAVCHSLKSRGAERMLSVYSSCNSECMSSVKSNWLSVNQVYKKRPLFAIDSELMCICSCMLQTPLSMSPRVLIHGRGFFTRSVKWWLPSDNKQRDLLSMTEHSCTWFHPVTEDSFKLQQSTHCFAQQQQQVPAGVCLVLAVFHPPEWSWGAFCKLWAV